MVDSRLKWRKRKRDGNSKCQKPRDDDDEAVEEDDDHDSQVNNPASDPVLDLREAEVLSDAGQVISDFPSAIRRTVNRPHRSSSTFAASAVSRPWAPPLLENISHGQLQVLSAVLPDNPSLLQPPVKEQNPKEYNQLEEEKHKKLFPGQNFR